MTSRSITGLVLAALLAVPAAAQAQARRGSSSDIWLNGSLGLESGDHDLSGLQLRFDGEVPLLRLTPQFHIAGVGTLSYSNLSHDVSDFEILPAIRFSFAANSQVGAYGDVGLGIYHAWQDSDSDTGATMRFGVGGYYEMTPEFRVLVDAAFHPHFGDYDIGTSFTLLVGLGFRI